MPEHVRIVADDIGFAAFDGQVLYYYFFGNHIRIFLMIGIACVVAVEIGKDLRSQIVVRRKLSFYFLLQ